MAKYKLAPTKTNLIKTKNSFAFAAEGHSLLEDKREILIAELLNLKEKAKEAEENFRRALADAYSALLKAAAKEGRARLQELSAAFRAAAQVNISSHKVMGVNLPRLQISVPGSQLFYFPYRTSLAVEEAAAKFRRSLEALALYAQYRVSILRLAREVKKTMRRVNALEKIYLPDYRQTISYIETFLQEQERESFFIQKLIKKKMKEERNGKRAAV